MPYVTFRRGQTLLAKVEAVPGERLLDLALTHQIPLHWRCGQGTCGTCRVWLPPETAGQRTRLEEGVLRNAAADSLPTETDNSRLRLACHVRVETADLDVELT